MEASKPLVRVDVRVTIELSYAEVKILEHLTSYNLLKTFASEFSKEYTEEFMKKTLSGIRSACHSVTSIHQECERAVRETLRKE